MYAEQFEGKNILGPKNMISKARLIIFGKFADISQMAKIPQHLPKFSDLKKTMFSLDFSLTCGNPEDSTTSTCEKA